MIDRALKRYLRCRHPGQSHVFRWLKRTSISKTLPVTSKTGLQLLAEWTDWAGLYLLRHGCLEPETSNLLTRLLRPGDTFVDVGAHIGYLSLVAAQQVGPRGRVVSIEPQPHNCDLLLRAAAANELRTLTLFCAAAGSSTSSIRLRLQDDQDHSRLSLLDDETDEAFGFVVPVLPLNSILATAACTKVDVLKIDVEGFELEVALGLDWDGAFRPRHVIAEGLSRNAEDTRRTREFVDCLTRHGYKASDICGQPWIQGMPLIEDNIWFQAEARS